MKDAIKMFSVIMPFDVYEKLKTMARDREVSIGKILREGAMLMLEERNEKMKIDA